MFNPATFEPFPAPPPPALVPPHPQGFQYGPQARTAWPHAQHLRDDLQQQRGAGAAGASASAQAVAELDRLLKDFVRPPHFAATDALMRFAASLSGQSLLRETCGMYLQGKVKLAQISAAVAHTQALLRFDPGSPCAPPLPPMASPDVMTNWASAICSSTGPQELLARVNALRLHAEARFPGCTLARVCADYLAGDEQLAIVLMALNAAGPGFVFRRRLSGVDGDVHADMRAYESRVQDIISAMRSSKPYLGAYGLSLQETVYAICREATLPKSQLARVTGFSASTTANIVRNWPADVALGCGDPALCALWLTATTRDADAPTTCHPAWEPDVRAAWQQTLAALSPRIGLPTPASLADIAALLQTPQGLAAVLECIPASHPSAGEVFVALFMNGHCVMSVAAATAALQQLRVELGLAAQAWAPAAVATSQAGA